MKLREFVGRIRWRAVSDVPSRAAAAVVDELDARVVEVSDAWNRRADESARLVETFSRGLEDSIGDVTDPEVLARMGEKLRWRQARSDLVEEMMRAVRGRIALDLEPRLHRLDRIRVFNHRSPFSDGQVFEILDLCRELHPDSLLPPAFAALVQGLETGDSSALSKFFEEALLCSPPRRLEAFIRADHQESLVRLVGAEHSRRRVVIDIASGEPVVHLPVVTDEIAVPPWEASG